MRKKHLQNPNLPFDDIPLSVELPKRTLSITSKLQQLISSIDWQQYEDNVVEAIRNAVNNYAHLYSCQRDEQVYQISICTNPQNPETAVNFETLQHALQHNEYWSQVWSNRNNLSKANQWKNLPYNCNPADFKYGGFYHIEHPELEQLRGLKFQFKTHLKAADARIEASLLRVVERILSEQILDRLPSEDEIWIGVSSPRDWYDHVRKVQTRP